MNDKRIKSVHSAELLLLSTGAKVTTRVRHHVSCSVLAVAVTAFVFCASTTGAYADFVPDCPKPLNVTAQSLFDERNQSLRAAVRGIYGEIAAPQEAFTSTDVITPGLPNRRLLFLWATTKGWIVAMEHGGRGYNDPIAVFRRADTGPLPSFVSEEIAFPATVCAVATALAQGVEHPGFKSARPPIAPLP